MFRDRNGPDRNGHTKLARPKSPVPGAHSIFKVEWLEDPNLKGWV